MAKYSAFLEQDGIISPVHDGEFDSEVLPKVGDDFVLPRGATDELWYKVVGVVHKPLSTGLSTILILHLSPKPSLKFWGTEGF